MYIRYFTNIHLFNITHSRTHIMKVTYNLRSRIVYEQQRCEVVSSPCIALIFDTETTGLLPRSKGNHLDSLDKCPYIIQLAYELYDSTNRITLESYNQYIRIDDSVEIEPGALNVHGITREKLHQKGIPIAEALSAFYNAYLRAQRIVAHNIEFDKTMIQIEMKRNASTDLPTNDQLFVNTTDEYCTMKHGIDICNLWVPSKIPLWAKLTKNDKIVRETIVVNGITYTLEKRMYKKNPRLMELYKKIHGSERKGDAHDARWDVEVCRMCYGWMVG